MYLVLSLLSSVHKHRHAFYQARNFKYKQAKEPVPARVALQWEQHINYRLCVQPNNVRSLGPGGLKSSASRRMVYTHWYNIHDPS